MSLPTLNLSISRLSELSLSTDGDCEESKKRDVDGTVQNKSSPVGVEEIIKQFLEEYKKALDKVEQVSNAAKADVQMRDEKAIRLSDQYAEIFEPGDVPAKQQYTNILEGAVADVRETARNTLLTSMTKNNIDKNKIAAAENHLLNHELKKSWKGSGDVKHEMVKIRWIGENAKGEDGSKLSSESKKAYFHLLNALREKSTKLREMEVLLRRSEYAIDMFTGYLLARGTQSSFQALKFSEACALFAEDARVNAPSAFSVEVRPRLYHNSTPGCGFAIHEVRWIQDLEFQRILVRLNTEAEGQQISRSNKSVFVTSNKQLVMKLELPCSPLAAKSREQTQCMNDGYVKRMCYLLAVEIASRRVRNWICDRYIAHKPTEMDYNESYKILGWNIRIPFAEHTWAKRLLTKIANAGNNDSSVRNAMPVLIARRLLEEGYTRKLGIIIQKGQVGIRGQKAESEVMEFGLGGQYCDNMSKALEFIVNTEEAGDNAMRALFASTINLTNSNNAGLQERFLAQNNRLLEFCKDQEKKVALLVWGQHARVLFKCDTFPWFRIVDPWKPKGNVIIPSTLYEHFWDDNAKKRNLALKEKNGLVWVEREAEQNDEGSCFMVATMRAMAIACAASSENNSDADLLRVAKQPPSQGMAPLCAAIATLTRNLTIQMKQGKTHQYMQIELFDEPPPSPPPPDSDPEDDMPLSQLIPGVKESPDSDDETLSKRVRRVQGGSG